MQNSPFLSHVLNVYSPPPFLSSVPSADTSPFPTHPYSPSNLEMNFTPTNTFLPSDDVNQQEPQDEDLAFSFDDILSNDFLDFGDFGVDDPLILPPSQLPPLGGILSGDVRPFPQTTRFNALPQSDIHPTIALQQPAFDAFDGTYTLLSHPSLSHRPDSSSATFDAAEQTSLFGVQNIPIPMPSSVPVPAATPAPAPSTLTLTSSQSWTNPISAAPAFGWPTGAPTPVVRTWDAAAAATDSARPASSSARAEPRQASVPRCSCDRRHPLVRVDDTVEWVRSDVVKVVLYFNWSPDAEDEAHESWTRC